MKKWEYKTIGTETAENGFKNPHEVTREINEAGKEGWRLLPIALSKVHKVFIMEREILEEQPEQKEQVLSPTAIALAEQRGN